MPSRALLLEPAPSTVWVKGTDLLRLALVMSDAEVNKGTPLVGSQVAPELVVKRLAALAGLTPPKRRRRPIA